jgi:hypothetical protein
VSKIELKEEEHHQLHPHRGAEAFCTRFGVLTVLSISWRR